MDKNSKVNILGQIIGVFTPQTPNAAAAQLGAAMFVHSLAVNGFSKPDERDADETALKMMSKMALYGVGDVPAPDTMKWLWSREYTMPQKIRRLRIGAYII